MNVLSPGATPFRSRSGKRPNRADRASCYGPSGLEQLDSRCLLSQVLHFSSSLPTTYTNFMTELTRRASDFESNACAPRRPLALPSSPGVSS